MAVVFGGTTCLLLDISRLHTPANRPLLDSFKMYCVYRLISAVGAWWKRRLLRDVLKIEKSQSKRLLQILKHARGTTYALSCGLDKVKTVDEFRSIHPVTQYAHYKDWVDRIIEGEENVLYPETTDFLGATSGTTSGISKLYPKHQRFTKSAYLRAHVAYWAVLLKTPKAFDLNYVFNFLFKPKTTMINERIERGPLSKLKEPFPYIQHIPFVGTQISDFNGAMHVNLVFALRELDIGIINFTLGSHMYVCFQYLEDNWQEICTDIERGTISRFPKSETAIILQLIHSLKPELQRAEELRNQFNKGFQDIIPRIWPKVAVITSIFTGSFAVYKRSIETRYSGGIPIRCSPHLGTESFYGLNVWESLERFEEFFPYHTYNFFEFVPECYLEEDQPPTLLLHELEVGERYEMAVTTFEGLYRYRTGDIIEVAGYEGQVPTYYVCHRTSDILSLYAEKTSLTVVTNSIEKSFDRWPGTSLVDYTTTESVNLNELLGKTDMGYVLIVEIAGENLTDEQKRELDENLQSMSESYRYYRQLGQIQALDVFTTLPGQFDELRKFLLDSNNDASEAQLKIPRKLANTAQLKILLRKE